MFHTIFYEPVYNLIAFILNNVPLHDIGTTIVIATIVVKVILLPLNLSALRSQYVMKRLDGEIKEIKKKHKDDAQTLSKKTMELYKREQVNPFSSLLVIFIQIPIFFALYFVFSKGMHADPESLYSFITFPETVHMKAFGLFDATQKNIYVALLAGISSYFLAKRQTQSMTVTPEPGKEGGFQEQFMKSMQIQLLYVLPVIIVFSGAILPSALSLYWFVSNVIGYLQDVYMKNKLAHLK